MITDLHHPCGPSRLARIMACPGSYRMCQYRPDEPASVDADEGRMLHGLLDPASTLPDLTVEQRETLDRARAQIATLTAGADSVTYAPPYLEWREAPDGEAITGGTPDVVAQWFEGELLAKMLVVEVKFGRVPVEAADANAQVYGYVALLAANMPEPARLTVIYAAVVQPRLAGRAQTPAAVDTARAMVTVKAAVARAQQPGLELYAGPHCRYCPARLDCPAQRLEQEALVPVAGGQELTIGGLAAWYEAWQVVKPLVEDRVQQFRAAVLAGRVPGWESKETSGGQEVTDTLAAIKALRDQGMPDAQILGCVTVSASQLRDAYATWAKAAGSAATLKAGKEIFAALLVDLLAPKPARVELRKVQDE